MRRTKPVPKPRNLLRTRYQTTWVRLDYGESRLVKCPQFDGSLDILHMYAHRRLAEIYHHTEILANMEGR